MEKMTILLFPTAVIPHDGTEPPDKSTGLIFIRKSSGKTRKKTLMQKAISPKKPSEISPSVILTGSDETVGLRAGPTSKRCSNQIPTIINEQRPIMGIGFVLMFLLRRTKKGMIKSTMNTDQANDFQGEP